MKNKLEQLKRKIWKAVPSILELKFGCKIKVKIGVFISKYGRQDNIKQFTIYRDIFNDNVLGTSDYDNSRTIKKEDITAILGRPIVWDDIALALENDINWFITRQGRFFYKGDEVAIWEWGKSLDQQSEETIDFLCEVILKN